MIDQVALCRYFNRARNRGQAATEALLLIALVVLSLVMLPDSAVETLMVAIEGRYQSIVRYAVMP